MERLQKVIAASGYTSRRKAEELIKAGKVYVNGKIVIVFIELKCLVFKIHPNYQFCHLVSFHSIGVKMLN